MTNTEQTLTVLSGEEILKNLSSKFWQEYKKLKDLNLIKTNGALDSIPNIKKKTVVNLENFRFIAEVQRIDNLQESNILKNLKEIGGFKHKSAGVADVFEYENQEIDYVTSPDGMHRWIMAYLSGVSQIAVNPQDVHSADASNQEIIDAEKQFFDDKNGRSAGITETDKMRSDKLSGKLNDKQKKLDETLEKVGINVGDIGAPKESANYSYKTISELDKVVINDKHPCYIDLEEFAETTSWMTDFIPKDGCGPRLHGAIANAKKIVGSIDDPVISKMFERWLKSSGKYSYSYYQTDWWTGKVQHSRNMENTTIRLVVAFNQWYREKFDGENCISQSDIQHILEVMNTETKQFVDDCIDKKMLIDYAPVAHTSDYQEEDDDFSSLDNEFSDMAV